MRLCNSIFSFVVVTRGEFKTIRIFAFYISNTFLSHESARPHVTIYTDGACSGNPGPGGYGVVLLDEAGNRRELSAGYRRTTNNRMELRGVIAALEALKVPCNVKLYSDSKYIINAIEEKWLNNWIKRGWKKADKKPVLNVDLWKLLTEQIAIHKITFIWTRGHAGDVENERCDELAVAASKGEDLLPDTDY
jgi:ribonuclease HI